MDVLRDEYGFVVRIDELTVEELRSAQATHDRQRKVWNALLGGKPRLDVTDPEVVEAAQRWRSHHVAPSDDLPTTSLGREVVNKILHGRDFKERLRKACIGGMMRCWRRSRAEH